MKKLLLSTAFTLTVSTLGFQSSAQACEVQIGELNWGSARVVTAVEKFILETGYDCKVEVIETTSVPGVTGMVEKGEPEILSEVWLNSVQDLINKALDEGKIILPSDVLADGGVEGWYVPTEFAKKNNIKTIDDVKANPQLFADPEDPSKGRFVTCPSGWKCQEANKSQFEAYGLGETFNLVDPGSGEGLSGDLAKAANNGTAWFGYYWSPTDILGKYDMTQIEMEPTTVEQHGCNADPECEENHAGTYPPSKVMSAMTADLKEREPAVYELISKVSFPTDQMNKTLAWQSDNNAEWPEAAAFFMTTYADTWKSWVSEDAAAKISKALGQ